MMTRLRELREGKKETQADIAYLLGITRASYTNIELGKRQPDLRTLRMLASHYEVSVDSLIGREGTEKSATISDDGLSDLDRELISLLRQLTPDDYRRVKDFVAGMRSSREE